MPITGVEQAIHISDLLARMQYAGVITEDDANEVRKTLQRGGGVDQHPLQFLSQQNLPNPSQPSKAFNEDSLVEWLAKQCEMSTVKIDPLDVDVAAVSQVMSFAFAQRHKILALKVKDDAVVVATAEPDIQGWEQGLIHVLGKPVERVLTSPSDLQKYTVEFYKLAESISSAVKSGGGGNLSISNLEQMLELGNFHEPDANDQHVVSIVDWLLQYAFDQRASDIHIEPRREVGHVRFRIDGMLHNVYDFPLQVSSAVISRIKILGRLDLAEKRRPQDGRIKTKRPATDEEIELRLSTLPTAFGEKLVMRVFDPEVLVKGFSQLGLSAEDTESWQKMTSKPHGIVLVTGPTGSGKTTTLYTTLKQLAVESVNVCTIEDPIEMVEPSFNQMQVNNKVELDFGAGVRALLRQDPDVIMVGEIRDMETAEMAIQAALTGHLVLSTLHTNDAPSAVTRLSEIGVPSYLIKASLLGVMAQRLVRTLCPNCKAPAEIDEDAWKELVFPWKMAKPAQSCKAVGCLECRNTGYAGRQGLYEIMLLENGVEEEIAHGVGDTNLRRAAIKNGMRTLRLSGAQKIAAGMTTMDEVLRVAPPVASFKTAKSSQ